MEKSRPPEARWPLPPDEHSRLKDLRALGILDTPREYAHDTLVEVAAALFDAPCAALSLIDADRQWLKAEIGVGEREQARENSFCTHAILGHDALVVPDATQDSRFRNNPMVEKEGGFRFYAGVPLTTRLGHRVGALCVIDFAPREADVARLRLLERLASLASQLLEQGRSPLQGAV